MDDKTADKTDDTATKDKEEETMTLAELARQFSEFRAQCLSRFETPPADDKKDEAPAADEADPEADADEKKFAALLEQATTLAASKAVKQFAASIGTKPVSAAPAQEKPKAKTFQDLVDDKTKELGDANKAMLYCLSAYPNEYNIWRPVSSKTL